MVDELWLEKWFHAFNHSYFEDILPLPRLQVSSSRTQLGSMSCKRKLTWRGITTCDYVIRISNYYVQTERQYQNVLLHEMIHYYISYKGICDTSPHGKVFCQIMHKLNQTYGWEIHVSSRCKAMIPAAKTNKKRSYLILFTEVDNRGCYLSVVHPHYFGTLAQSLSRIPAVKKYCWYTSSDSYFSDFPTVRTLRGRKLSQAEWEKIAEKLKPLDIRLCHAG